MLVLYQLHKLQISFSILLAVSWLTWQFPLECRSSTVISSKDNWVSGLSIKTFFLTVLEARSQIQFLIVLLFFVKTLSLIFSDCIFTKIFFQKSSISSFLYFFLFISFAFLNYHFLWYCIITMGIPTFSFPFPIHLTPNYFLPYNYSSVCLLEQPQVQYSD